MNPLLSVSVVSHGQYDLVEGLLADLRKLEFSDYEVLLTANIPEPMPVFGKHGALKIIRNQTPKGFGANHNQAFARSRGRYFAVLNPDLRLIRLDIPALISELNCVPKSVVAPKIVGPEGKDEDSARKFPTLPVVLGRYLARTKRTEYQIGSETVEVDWVGGMFMLFERSTYHCVGGFDERYYMYYEDVDICRRIRGVGGSVRVCPSSVVVHEARRASRKNLRHLRWHLRSAVRYFTGL